MSSLRNVRRSSVDSESSKMVMEVMQHQVDPQDNKEQQALSALDYPSSSSSKEEKEQEDWRDSLGEYSNQIVEIGKSWTCTMPTQYLRSFAWDVTTKKKD